MNGKVLNKRTLTASIAADNGRAAEFIRRRVYKDKSRCYECGEAFEDDNWASVVDTGADQRLLKGSEGLEMRKKGKKEKKASYFSDESDEEE
ncbi:unnamed protein product, partial [Vitis vinifera]